MLYIFCRIFIYLLLALPNIAGVKLREVFLPSNFLPTQYHCENAIFLLFQNSQLWHIHIRDKIEMTWLFLKRKSISRWFPSSVLCTTGWLCWPGRSGPCICLTHLSITGWMPGVRGWQPPPAVSSPWCWTWSLKENLI